MAVFGFVADDLTGASDVLAQAHRYGMDAALVIGDAPLPADTDVVGIAGPARSLGGDAFDRLVRTDLGRLAELDLEVLLYKVCSTFDSSPTTGSIGRGIELMRERFPAHGPVAVAPAQPVFGRHTAFSTHYAAHAGRVYRLDRHPVMCRHPSTPMHEADLRLVLAQQLAPGTGIGAIHLPAYADGAFGAQWAERRNERDGAFVVDAVEEQHLDAIARGLTGERDRTGPALVVGSGGIMAALARTRTGAPARASEPQGASGPVLAVSASASAVTAEQIGNALSHGWADVPVPPQLLAAAAGGPVDALDAQVAAALSDGRDVVVHTTRGTDDPRYARTGPVDPRHVGSMIGGLAARMASRGLTQDIVICGGDTSSHALIAMGVRELRVAAQFVVAGPVCRTDGDATVAGCRLLLKGGQVGPPDVLRRFAAPAMQEESG